MRVPPPPPYRPEGTTPGRPRPESGRAPGAGGARPPYQGGHQGGRLPERRPGGRRGARVPRRAGWGARLATTLSVLVLGAGGVGHAVVTSLDSGIGRVDAFKDMKDRPAASHGMNLLLVGTDGRATISTAEKRKYRLGGAPCHCTDTIMLMHLSQGGKRASVVSLPRDSYTRLPSHPGGTPGARPGARPGTGTGTGTPVETHPAKLNAAYAEGGPSLTVSTVEAMTGVKIDHYLEVDFTSFMKTVDALGGVQICTPRVLKDPNTGLELTAGPHTLSGGQALQYVRSRHIEGDGSADLGRMQRQQRFVAATIARATDSGVLMNPVRFQAIVSAVLDSVRADAGFDPEQLLALGRAMRGFSPSSSEFASVPLAEHGVTLKGVGSAVKWDPGRARQMFRALKADRPLAPPHRADPSAQRAKVVDVPPAQIRVQVYNGTTTKGLGRRVDDALRATGFDTTRQPVTEPALRAGRTVVEYDPGWDRSARSLAAALPGSALKAVKGLGSTLRVVAGRDFTTVAPVRAEDTPEGTFGTMTGDEVVCP